MFIELTQEDGDPVLVNLDNVTKIFSWSDVTTAIHFTNDSGIAHVKEPYAQVFGALRTAMKLKYGGCKCTQDSLENKKTSSSEPL